MRISSTATTSAEMPSSAKLAPSKADAVSAAKPAGPVTWSCRPSGRPSLPASRMSAMESARPPPLISPGRARIAWAASSASGTAGESCSTDLSPSQSPSCSMADSGSSMPAIASAEALAAPMSCGPRGSPSSRENTAMAVSWSPPGNSEASSWTLADSESCGRVAGAESPGSRFAVRPVRPPTNSRPIRMAMAAIALEVMCLTGSRSETRPELIALVSHVLCTRGE